MLSATEAKKLAEESIVLAENETISDAKILYEVEMKIRMQSFLYKQTALLLSYRKDTRFADNNNEWISSEVFLRKILGKLKASGYKTRVIENDETKDLIISWD